MSDLRVVAIIPAEPGSVEVLRHALTTLAAASRSHQGCVAYELFESAVAAGTFVTIETWESRADLDAHSQFSDVATAMEAADGRLAGDIAIHPLAPTGE
jgi:quinol monooxygenase YgiN